MTQHVLVRALVVMTAAVTLAAVSLSGRLASFTAPYVQTLWVASIGGAIPLVAVWICDPAPRWAGWWLLAAAAGAHWAHLDSAWRFEELIYVAPPLAIVLLQRATAEALVSVPRGGVAACPRPAAVDLVVGGGLLLLLMASGASWRGDPAGGALVLAVLPGALVGAGMMLAIERDPRHRRVLSRVLLGLTLLWLTGFVVWALVVAEAAALRMLASLAALIGPELWLLLALTVLERPTEHEAPTLG